MLNLFSPCRDTLISCLTSVKINKYSIHFIFCPHPSRSIFHLRVMMFQVRLNGTDEHPDGKKMALKYANLELEGESPPDVDISDFIGGPCHPQNPTAVAVLQATHPDEIAKYNCKQGGNQGGLWVSGDLDDVCAIARADAARCVCCLSVGSSGCLSHTFLPFLCGSMLTFDVRGSAIQSS